MPPCATSWRIKDPFLNKIAVWTYYKGAQRDEGIDAGATTVAYVPEKGWFWYIPQHNDMISVGVVAEGKYLTRGGLKAPEEIFQPRGGGEPVDQAPSRPRASKPALIFSPANTPTTPNIAASDGLLLVGDAFAFLDPVFSSGVMLALKSGTMAGDAVHQALVERDFSPGTLRRLCAAILREGVENMRKLVYAFYNPKFSFRQLTNKYPEAAGWVTDCLSGDVNKDFAPLWKRIEEFVPLPAPLPVGQPLAGVPQAPVAIA